MDDRNDDTLDTAERRHRHQQHPNTNFSFIPSDDAQEDVEAGKGGRHRAGTPGAFHSSYEQRTTTTTTHILALFQTLTGTRGQPRMRKRAQRGTYIHTYKAWAWSSSVENHMTNRPHTFNVHKTKRRLPTGEGERMVGLTHQLVVVLTHAHTLPYMHTFIVSHGGIGVKIGEERRVDVRAFLNSEFFACMIEVKA